MIGGNALQTTDCYRAIFDAAAAAGRLTGSVADTAQDAREYIRFTILYIGV